MNKQKLNICFTSPSQNAYSETFIQNLKGGIEGEVFHCFGDLFPYLTMRGNIQSYKTPPLKDIFLHKIGWISGSLREYYFIRFLKENQINIIFANYGPSGALLAPIAKKLGVPLIVHFHGYDASIFSVLEKYRKGYQEMFKVARRLIVVSNEMEKDLLKLGAPKENLIQLTCAPHTQFLDLEANYRGKKILAVGRFVEKKAPYLTLMAFQKAKEKCIDLKLKFVGEGDLLSVCKDLCNSLNIKDVEFLGIKSPKEVSSLMQKSFCFVQHSKQASNGDKEGIPVAILEAMAVGLPIVSTRHAGIPEVVKEGESGYLVEEGDVEGMAKNIEELYFNREKAEKMGNEGKKFISQNLGQQEYFARVNSIIKELGDFE